MDTSKKKSIALVVHACDRYQLLYRGFEFFFKKHWKELGDINCYFLTENIDYKSYVFKNIKTGKAEWSDRLKKGLKEIDEEYIIYIQEDMWFKKPVDIEILKGVLHFAVENSAKLIKLHSSEVYKTIPTSTNILGLNVSLLNNGASKFLMSHQISIWNRQFLMSQLPKNEHPWRHERKGTKRLKSLGIPIYQIDLFAENGKPAININQYEDYRSEYQTISLNGILNDNILPFFSVLAESNDIEDIEYSRNLLHNYENGITHDGLPKPRKVGLIKKIFM